jgi:hypothetical protein
MTYPVTENRMEDGGDKWVIGAGGTLEFEDGATVTGLDSAATFASNAEALTGTVSDKNIAPSSLKYVLDAILGVQGATITVGAEANDVINVAIQLKDYSGDDLAVRGSVQAFLTDASAGEAETATVPDGGVAIGTDGGCIPLVADKVFLLTSEADGDIDLDIEESGAGTWYLVIVLPNGKRVVSGAITFAGA